MSKSVTFLCDDEIHANITTLANEEFEGNFSLAIRKILKDWNKNEH